MKPTEIGRLIDEEQELSKRLLTIRDRIDDLLEEELAELYEAMISTEKKEGYTENL